MAELQESSVPNNNESEQESGQSYDPYRLHRQRKLSSSSLASGFSSSGYTRRQMSPLAGDPERSHRNGETPTETSALGLERIGESQAFESKGDNLYSNQRPERYPPRPASAASGSYSVVSGAGSDYRAGGGHRARLKRQAAESPNLDSTNFSEAGPWHTGHRPSGRAAQSFAALYQTGFSGQTRLSAADPMRRQLSASSRTSGSPYVASANQLQADRENRNPTGHRGDGKNPDSADADSLEPQLKSAGPAPAEVQDLTRPAFTFTVDTLISALRITIFSPTFVLVTPLALLGRGFKTDSREFWWSCVYAGVICGAHVLNHLARVYNSGFSWIFSPRKIDWPKQIVLVTGGAGGVGRRLVDRLALKGATVVVLDIQELESKYSTVRSYKCDVSSATQVRKIGKILTKEVGDPTIIVNNAGVVSGKLILDLDDSDIKRTYAVNVLSHFWTLRSFLPAMIEKGTGHVVTVGSVLGLVGSAQMTDYCSSKAALVSLHDCLTWELRSRYRTSIRTTLVLPSHLRTPLFSKIQFPNNPIFRFFAPSSYPDDVVERILDALEQQESRVIRLPFFTHAARFLSVGAGLVPGWARDFMQWISNADYAMSAYGHQGDQRLLCRK